MGEFSYIITNQGLAKIAAHQSDPVNNPAVNITQIAVGDGNGSDITPIATMTALVNEQKRVAINDRGIDPVNSAKMFFIGRIPPEDYGYAIREAGLFDSTGMLIAVRKYPLINKIAQHNLIEVHMKEELLVTNTSDFTLTVDPNIINATQEWVNNEMADHVTDPNAHASLFAQKASLGGNQNQKFFVDNPTDPKHAINKQFFENNAKSYTTYCVNSGNVDANGYPDLINKISDTEISFKVGGSYPNIFVTFPNGKNYEIASIENVNITLNGTIVFVIEEPALAPDGNGKYTATAIPINIANNNITEASSAPAISADGDYLLLLSQTPYIPQKKINGSWGSKQFIKVGQITRTAGIIGLPLRSYSFNGIFRAIPDYEKIEIRSLNTVHKENKDGWLLIIINNENTPGHLCVGRTSNPQTIIATGFGYNGTSQSSSLVPISAEFYYTAIGGVQSLSFIPKIY